MHEHGFSVEWHDFECATALDWARSFHPDSLELCLNLSGHARLSLGGQEVEFSPQSWALYYRGQQALSAWRLAGERHQFLTIELSRDFLGRHLTGREPELLPWLARLLTGQGNGSTVSAVQSLQPDQQQWVLRLQQPPVVHAARALWYQAKALELIAQFFFSASAEAEFFCDRQKRLARERVQRVGAILRECLVEPPDLEELGRRVGCSPFYLSRTFSAEMGKTIPQFLRQIRMERAAELLRSGKYNVTEAAMEVGYSSLSHFSQAFCQTMGCCPVLYPQAAALVGKPVPSKPVGET